MSSCCVPWTSPFCVFWRVSSYKDTCPVALVPQPVTSLTFPSFRTLVFKYSLTDSTLLCAFDRAVCVGPYPPDTSSPRHPVPDSVSSRPCDVWSKVYKVANVIKTPGFRCCSANQSGCDGKRLFLPCRSLLFSVILFCFKASWASKSSIEFCTQALECTHMHGLRRRGFWVIHYTTWLFSPTLLLDSTLPQEPFADPRAKLAECGTGGGVRRPRPKYTYGPGHVIFVNYFICKIENKYDWDYKM